VISATAPSITSDTGWYDSGSTVVVSYNYVWNLVPQQSRLAATGYSVDGGAVITFTKVGTGTFNVLVIMNSAHAVDVKYVTQYYVSFQFNDAVGRRTVVPSALEIAIGTETQPVPGFTIWLDNGTSFTIASVTYEGLDVKPPTAQQFSVTGPATMTLKDNVYDATIKVTDFLGLAVSGAGVKMTLANGTVISGSTGGDGIFGAPAIPLGTFTATVSGIGSSTLVTGDASKQSVTPASVAFSTNSLSLVVAIIVVATVLVVLLLRRRARKGGNKPMVAAQKAAVSLMPCDEVHPTCALFTSQEPSLRGAQKLGCGKFVKARPKRFQDEFFHKLVNEPQCPNNLLPRPRDSVRPSLLRRRHPMRGACPASPSTPSPAPPGSRLA